MHPACRNQLNAARSAAGRKPLTDAQALDIESRLGSTMRQMAREDIAAWRAMTPDDRMAAAAKRAAEDIAAEAARKVENAQRQVLKTAETERRIGEARKPDRVQALVFDFERTNSYIDGIKRDNVRGLMDLIQAAGSRQDANAGRQALMFLFDAENPQMTRDLALEVFAEGKAGTGNAQAKAAALAWLKMSDAMRKRFNAAGGDVGKLDYGYLPQAHDQMRVRQAGSTDWLAQQARQVAPIGVAKAIVKDPPPAFAANAWAQDVLPLLDRSRYLKEDGARMNDAEVLDVLRGAWETISTDGMNKSAPGAFKGSGARSNRGSQSREIHFKDGEAYLDYLKKYGTGSMYDAMIGHIGGLARDIGLVERYGPNPEAQALLQFDLAARATGTSSDALPRVFGNRPDAYWRLLNGSAGTPQSARIAQVGQHVRNVETFSKLQGAVLSSITDLGTYFATAGYNKLSYFDAIKNIVSANRKDARDFMNAHGLIAESLISDLNRWSGENVAQSWSGQIANATMRLSLMNLWTDSLRRAFQLTHMQGIGKMRGTAWAQLAEYDRWRMEQHGITEADWGVIQAAQPTLHNGSEFVTPDGIYATGDARAGEVAAKYLGMLSDESEVAVLNPDMATRAITSAGGTRRGTINGELWRAFMQFKSFPIAMMSRHWRRMLETPEGMEGAPALANKWVYGGSLMVTLTMLGAVAFQSKQIVSGKDPVDMTTPKFWSRAAAQGGGLGFAGDLILGDTADDRSPMDSFGRLLAGPSFGSGADAWELTKGNIDEELAGKKSHFGAEAFRFARGHAPLVNLWYAKAALDHAGLHALQENLSPGYLSRIQSKARKDWNQQFWWQPGTGLPERAPSFQQLAGQ